MEESNRRWMPRWNTLGHPDAPVSLVEYGSYDCPNCRAAHERIAQLRSEFGDRLAYTFRHRPIPGNRVAHRAAVLVERAEAPRQFWKAHVALMQMPQGVDAEQLEAVSRQVDLATSAVAVDEAEARVQRDIRSAEESGVVATPTFFINGRRYDGPWDDASLSDALLGTLGHRVQVAALDFVNWPPSTGVLLLLATLFAVAVSNTPFGPAYAAFWQTQVGVQWGSATFELALLQWINDGLLTIFFLVVGLEIKREFTVGHLASRRRAALPVAAALGGMVLPALIYLAVTPAGPWKMGWGVPIATDTAFAVAIMATMGGRAPVELRIFLTAAAIVDDIAAIAVVALFYSDAIRFDYMVGACIVVAGLFALNRAHVHRVTFYGLLVSSTRPFPVTPSKPIGSGILDAAAAVERARTFGQPLTARPLVSGTTVAMPALGAGQGLLYSIDVPAGATRLEFISYGGTGTISVYLNFEAEPFPTANIGSSLRPGTNQALTRTAPAPGRYYFKVVGKSSASGVMLRAKVY